MRSAIKKGLQPRTLLPLRRPLVCRNRPLFPLPAKLCRELPPIGAKSLQSGFPAERLSNRAHNPFRIKVLQLTPAGSAICPAIAPQTAENEPLLYRICLVWGGRCLQSVVISCPTGPSATRLPSAAWPIATRSEEH